MDKRLEGKKNVYVLNGIRKRLGMECLESASLNALRKERRSGARQEPEGAERPEATERQILFMVFAAMVPEFLQYYPWDIWPEDFSEREWGKVEAFYAVHKEPMSKLSDPNDRVLYALGLMKKIEMEEA